MPGLVEFVEANEPRLIAFNEYVNEAGDEVSVVQFHPDTASMEAHIAIIAERVRVAYRSRLLSTETTSPFAGRDRQDRRRVGVARAYTHTSWVVTRGREEEFIERWREWADWSRREGLAARAMLLRDADNPERFVSFGPWESMQAVRTWRGSPGYQERVAKLREVVDSFEPRTLELVAGG